MPESPVRKQAKAKKQHKQAVEGSEQRSKVQRTKGAPRPWVPYVFVPVFLLGVLWLVIWNLAGTLIPPMAAIGNWNVGIGLVLIVAGFSLMTLWK
ncbi:MAG: cell division protein CrgA [Arachnia sp.]